MRLRSTLLLVHRWVGLLSGLVLLVLALTGCLLIFQRAIDRAVNPATSYVTPQASRLPVEMLVERVTDAHREPIGMIFIGAETTWSYEARLTSGSSVFVDPYTGALLGSRVREKGVTETLLRIHTSLLAGAPGQLFVGGITTLALLLSLSGVVLWWPRRLFRVGTSRSWRRTTLDLHHVVGFWASLVICVISLRGALIAFGSFANPLIAKLDERPPLNARSLSSSTRPGARRIPVDQALAVARAALPGAFASAVSIPALPADFYQIFLKFPEDRSPSRRSRAYVDQFSGQLVGVLNTRTALLGTRMLNLKRGWHTGDILARLRGRSTSSAAWRLRHRS